MPIHNRALSPERPSYMRHIGMAWARFVEGAEGAPPATPAPPADPVPAPPAEPADGDKPLGENGEKDLRAEREARQALEKQVAEFKAKEDAAESAKLSDIDRANKERDDAKAEAVAARSELAVAALARQHGITDEGDIAALAAVPDEAVRTSLAARLASNPAPIPKPEPVPKAGTGNPIPSGGTGTVSAGRDLYLSRKATK